MNVSAAGRRMTETWRLSLALDGGYRDQRFAFPGQPTSVNVLRGANLNGRAVRALTAHWSWRALAWLSRSDFSSKRLGLRVAPVVEYNAFPWSQATTMQLTVAAAAGRARFRWRDTTLFDRIAEGRPFAQVVTAFSNRESWGSNSVRVLHQAFLDDGARQRLSLNADVQLRIAKGLSVERFGECASIRDQIFLPRADATRDEVLVRQRALATNCEYWFGVGVNCTFGSICDAVVNQRLERVDLLGFQRPGVGAASDGVSTGCSPSRHPTTPGSRPRSRSSW